MLSFYFSLSTHFPLALFVILFHLTKFIFPGHSAVQCFFMLSSHWLAYMPNGALLILIPYPYYLAAPLALSYAIYQLYDRPISRYRRKWTVSQASLQLS